jgi:hypothetical protein
MTSEQHLARLLISSEQRFARLQISVLYADSWGASRFDFTKAQWQEILSAVLAGCARPALFPMAALLREANEYLLVRPHHMPAAAESAAWERVARLMRQTREAIAIARPLGGGGGTICDDLDRWQQMAANWARNIAGSKQCHPRSSFFEVVLNHWTAAGGFLKFSRAGSESRNKGKLGGPTMRYLTAVSGPVLGADTPSPEGLRKQIERCASEFEELLVSDQRWAAFLEAIHNPAISDACILILPGIDRVKRTNPPVDDAEDRARARRLIRGPRANWGPWP